MSESGELTTRRARPRFQFRCEAQREDRITPLESESDENYRKTRIKTAHHQSILFIFVQCSGESENESEPHT